MAAIIWKKLGPFTGAAATADGVAMTVAVLAARSRIACGLFPGFLAMRRFKLSSGAAEQPALRNHIGWQEWRDSNPRLSVLETDALPAELHSYAPSPARRRLAPVGREGGFKITNSNDVG